MPDQDPTLERWRLVLGEAGGAVMDADAGQGGAGAGQRQGQGPGAGGGQGGLSAEGLARDAALDWLYQRDGDLDRRGVRHSAGSGPSALTTVDWLDDIHRLFPKQTIERLERDAVERYGINEIVTDPGVLSRIEPNPTLLRAVLRTKHLMNPQVLDLARKLVAEVVEALMEKVRADVRQAFSGSRSRRPTRLRRASSFDIHRTIRENLEHYDPQERRIYVETPHFRAREKRHLDRWQIILVVDQSGSMVGSVIHSAITAACLWGLPGIKAHLVAFDTEVVDLTCDVDDPVELLMKVQLGGGTDIARAVAYAARLVEAPRRTILAVVSDLYEGGDAYRLVRTVRGLAEQGTHVLCLAALDEEANPAYDRELGQKLADVGAHVGAMTPGQIAAFVAERIGR